jgi:hypothetical protein
MIPRGVCFGAPAAGRQFGALEGVMTKVVTVEVLDRLVEAEAPFQSVDVGNGREP